MGLLALLAPLSGCGDEHREVTLLEHPNVFVAEGGRQYTLTFPGAVDSEPVGASWSSSDFGGSPLAFMERMPVVFKADDFGAPLSESKARFLETLDALGARASLGIIASRIPDDVRDRDTYVQLDDAGFELWFHGVTHGADEFSGSGPAAQEAAFREGIELGRSKLGVDFHAFGAPQNAIDADTGPALASFPQLVVWLFGRADAQLDPASAWVFPRLVEGEEEVGVMRAPEPLLQDIAALAARDVPPAVLTLQVHPGSFTTEDFDRAQEFCTRLLADGRFRFTSPYDLWKWRHDAGVVTLRKTGTQTYLLDLDGTVLDHRIELDPEMPPPTVAVAADS